MYPTTVEQNRQDNIHPQTVHLHMHQLCTCVHPYYPGYRPPPLLASPFPVQPIPRPYNLQHYQYTQFNVSPYNFPLAHNPPISQPQSITSPHHSSTSNLDFGSLRERRNYDVNDVVSPEGGTSGEPKETRDFFDGLLSVGSLAEGLQNVSFQDALPLPSENFTKFLEQGCVLAEKIAIRNQHRPCFKNIQNLCNRTRGEILKPSNTVSNIHSQGIPWATKDFIYAFVRLINCWHMLKGYLDSKDGTLGNIDKELTPDFKACYLAWEKDTKELSAHMVRIFSNLDNHVSNPSPSNNYLLRNKNVAQNVTPKAQVIPVGTPIPQPKETPNSKAVRGILHIPPTQTEVVEAVIFSESTGTSPREEDSDNESRVYMKPGSYNVPKKTNSSNNSSPSIEFFDTAQNVSAHYKKLAKKKTDPILSSTEKMWQDAQSAVPYLLNKINPTQQDNLVGACEDPDDALKYFIDLNTLEQGSDIQEWLNSNNFVENSTVDINDGSIASPTSQENFLSKPVTLLQRAHHQKSSKKSLSDFSGDLLMSSLKTYQMSKTSPIGTTADGKSFSKKRNDEKISLKSFSSMKRGSNVWENEKGGLSPNAYLSLEKIVKILEGHEVALHFPKEDNDVKNPLSLDPVSKKVKGRKYQFLNEFVHDVRHIAFTAENYYEEDVLIKVKDFSNKFEAELNHYFPTIDFSTITGERNEDVSYSVLKRSRKEGDGDH